MSWAVFPAMMRRRAAGAVPSVPRLRAAAAAAAAPFSSSSSDADPGTYGRRAYDLRTRLDRQQQEEEKGGGAAASHPSTILSHAGIPPQTDRNDPLSPPIELATTYGRPPDGVYGPDGMVYARADNATRRALEDVMGTLELTPPPSASASAPAPASSAPVPPPAAAAASCSAFSSGMAAVSAVLLAHPGPVRVVLPDDVYHGVPTQLETVLGRHGITWDRVDMTDLEDVRRVLEGSVAAAAAAAEMGGGGGGGGGGSVVLWLETPSNPLCKVTDIRALCDLAAEYNDKTRADANKAGGGGGGYGGGGCDAAAAAAGTPSPGTITTVVDSTWAPPPITHPLLLGADAVLHSGTKYLGGHSDVLLGIVTCSPHTPVGRWLGPNLKTVQANVGAVASPFDSWLTLRGMRTLHVRLERQCLSAMELAEFLRRRAEDLGSMVEQVHYPGLADHPGHGISSSQMADGMYGGMLSFEVCDERTATAVAGAVRTVRRGTSLGGTETLIEHRASIEPRDRVTSPPGLLRVSVGLEDVEDIKYDLDRALEVARRVVGRSLTK